VYLRPNGNGVAEFDAQLSLGPYDLPPESLVSIEAYRQTSWMRFTCGTVGQLTLPHDRKLTEFDTHDGVLFRGRVTASSEPEGLLLAEADQIQPKAPDEADEKRISLLPAKPDCDLGEELYRVDLEEDRPSLLINSRLGDWRAVARDPVFISLVYPAAMREILKHSLRIEGHFDSEDMTDWKSQWLYFAQSLAGVGSVPPEDRPDLVDDWINDAVSAFCRRCQIAQKFESYWIGEVT
jgi:hypothetical protein